MRTRPTHFTAAFTMGCLALLTTRVPGAPVVETYPAAGPDDNAAVAASPFAGRYAVADTYEDNVEIRDVRQNLLRTITKAEILAFAPWMDLNGNPDGPCGLAWSDSGRLLFVLVYDGTDPGDGGGSDIILRYDAFDDALTLFMRLELDDVEGRWPYLGVAHHAGRLYVGTVGDGVRVYRAQANDTIGSFLGSVALPGGSFVRGLVADREAGLLYAASESEVYRAPVGSWPLAFVSVGPVADLQAIDFSTHYGGAGDDGLYALSGTSGVVHIPTEQARGNAAFAPTVYTAADATWHDLAATADGALLVGADEDARWITDDSDARLDLDGFIQDEFDEAIAFGRNLIAPDGEPDGWVIDGDVFPAWNRFHPATPDAACWTILLLLMDDYVNGAPDAQERIRTILQRYAGLATDGIGPDRSADGFFEHWTDPNTGLVKGGWPQEYATYSTMKIVLAADRAAAYYPDDLDIRAAAQAITCTIGNWDAYIQPGTDAVSLIAAAGGGPQAGALNNPFTEGIIFVEQAGLHGGTSSADAFARWINPALWPTASYLAGRPITNHCWGCYLPAFITGYSHVTQAAFRADPAWLAHTENLLASSAAWTDDAAPDFFTVFSAGSTKSEWGGYNADSLGNHPGDIATFTSLMSFCARGDINPAVSAYHAYRNGARQTFKAGASILYRRSAVDPAWEPNAAGLPDVGIGGLGLAEILAPGSVAAVLAKPYNPDICAPAPTCPGDTNDDGLTNVFDFSRVASGFGITEGATPLQGDLDDDGDVDVFDFAILAADFGCDVN